MHKTNSNNEPIRHGEVILKLTSLPKDLESKTKKVKTFIVGHSESGHHHVLESKKTFTVHEVSEAFSYLVLTEEANLVHKKDTDIHDTLTLVPGVYKVNKKTEYSPFTKVREAVWD